MRVVRRSVLRCPHCGFKATETLPANRSTACHCVACGELIRSTDDECCVFCRYGSVPCPEVQRASGELPEKQAKQS